jgi:hypothetical protein
MNYPRVGLAALGGFAACFVLGGLAFGLLPSLRNEFMKYPDVYRTQESMKSVMPAGMVAMFVGMVVLAVIYAMLYRGGSGLGEGARFGALIGVFSVCSFVVHNYVNLNIGLDGDWHGDWPHLPARREALTASASPAKSAQHLPHPRQSAQTHRQP